MKIRFSITSFIKPTQRIGILGSIAALGNWKPEQAQPLEPFFISKDENEPSMWATTITIPNEYKDVIEYKFIRWDLPEVPLTPTGSSLFPLENDLAVPQPLKLDIAFESPTGEIEWEVGPDGKNRGIAFSSNQQSKIPLRLLHIIDRSLNMVLDVYTLPVTQFLESKSGTTELNHTSRSYYRIKDSKDIQYERILNKILVGSCPRKLEHIKMLKEKENISDIVNLQTLQDAKENSLSVLSKDEITEESLFQLYDTWNLRYLWHPIEDMNSNSRSRHIPQVAFLIAGLMARKDCTGIYVHCNAGVGRSSACVAAYMHFCLAVSLRLTNLIINARRPVSYFDDSALLRGARDFEKKFSDAIEALNLNKL